MSSLSQTNGKKSSSGGSSIVNTPASTPVSAVPSISNGQSATQTSPPPNNNAPKFGTLVPNRIFVGGISANTTENELMQLFSQYGTVKAAKIIQDRAGVSKGYGFITFDSEDDAKRLQRESDNITLRERKLNIAPAIKKQPYSRAFDGASPPTVAAGSQQYYFPGTIPFFQGNVTYYQPPAAASGDPNTPQPAMYQAPTVYPAQSGPPQSAPYPPMIFPAQPMYMPQQYPMQMPYEYNYYPNGGPQYMVGGQGGPQSQVPPMQRPGSPPRQPCYGQQLPYNPAEAMYYNVPMYGTMEGPSVYQDNIDMPNGAPLPEEYSVGEQQHIQPLQDVETVTMTYQQITQQNHHHNLHQQPPPLAPPLHHQQHDHMQDEAIALPQQAPQPQQQQHFENQQPQQHPETFSRQHNSTPVVSVLSDNIKVKDVTSMQSGRRRKIDNESAPNNNNNGNPAHNYNGYTTAYQNYAAVPVPHTIYNYQSQNSNNNAGFNVPPFPFELKYAAAPRGAMSNGRGRGTRTFRNDRRSFESSSISTVSSSGLRTQSNSPGSHTEENNKTITRDVETPPPPPYSPMTNQYNSGNRYGTNGNNYRSQPNRSRGARNYNNSSYRKPNGPQYYNGSGNHGNHHVDSRVYNHKGGEGNQKTDVVNHNNNNAGNHGNHYNPRPDSSGSGTIPKPSVSVPQVHAGQPHFIPPVRRARRSVRRTAPLNEIGAGDAPLPNAADVGEACKKLDSLKL